jgi:hypothetical protein
MNVRRIALVLLLVYETLDFADPLIPGAVNFNDDQTVYSAMEPRPSSIDVAPLHVEVLPDAIREAARRSHRRPAVVRRQHTSSRSRTVLHRRTPPAVTFSDPSDDH